jgi:hypothetical protein
MVLEAPKGNKKKKMRPVAVLRVGGDSLAPRRFGCLLDGGRWNTGHGFHPRVEQTVIDLLSSG